jgi:hypothetical protein
MSAPENATCECGRDAARALEAQSAAIEAVRDLCSQAIEECIAAFRGVGLNHTHANKHGSGCALATRIHKALP